MQSSYKEGDLVIYKNQIYVVKTIFYSAIRKEDDNMYQAAVIYIHKPNDNTNVIGVFSPSIQTVSRAGKLLYGS